MHQVLNKSEFLNMTLLYMQELRSIPSFSKYVSIMPKYASICPSVSLNMPENGLILLNILEYAYKYLNKFF